jgi:AmiR/NasT family two-component response regulator
MDQATEMLMQRGGCTEPAAFARLQSWSRLAGIGLTEAAARVVDQPD